MANIPLRAYEKMIEESIEQNHLQEAVAHCKHILKTYPKCISTYRILGKAFLEGKSYSETADVFKRVLTVFPDDFISHVGMSLVRENENNLDAAIWHMELAFDSQPSNITIQEELKRLFGRRDGTHPTKIRLTRGALVRMYARGELYQQAIAEINSALSEDVKRMDLEVFLAKMYFLSGDQKSAIDLCQKLEKEAPYCYEVNKILFETSPNANHADKNNPYAVRLMELDPYEGFINARFPTLEDIPDDKVLIDELTDLSTISSAREDAWVSNLNNEWEKPSFIPEPVMNAFSDQPSPEPSTPSSVPSPENISGDLNSPAFPTPFGDPKSQNSKSEDWLSELSDSAVSDKPDETPHDHAAPADVPDWLSSLVPEDGNSEPVAPVASPSPAFMGFDSDAVLDENSSDQSKSEPTQNQSMESGQTKQPADDSDLPDWLKNFEGEKTSEPVSQDDLPDWLNSLDAKPKTSEPAVQAFADQEPTPNNGKPGASVFSFDEPEATAPQPPLENNPADFLAPEVPASTESNGPEEPVEQPVAEKAEGDIPDWIRMLHNSEEKDAAAISAAVETPAEDLPKAVLPQEPAADDTGFEPASPDQAISDKTGDDLLDWLRDLKPEDNQSVFPENDATGELKGNTEGLSYDFDAELNKLSAIESEPKDEIKSPAEQPASTPIDDTDDFLKSLAGIQGFTDVEPESEPQPIENAPQAEPAFSEETEKPIDFTSVLSNLEPDKKEQPVEPLVQEEPVVEEIQPQVQNPIGSLDELLAQTRDNPADYQSWRMLGDAYADLGRYSDALLAYNKAEQILIKSK
jgi:tetratricopeptide (TPR) repeat protein